MSALLTQIALDFSKRPTLEVVKEEPKYTYKRTKAQRGTKVQCPTCLKTHCAKSDGSLVRHGWKETGRIMGEYGNGYQWGECFGWSMPPLEETDEHALATLKKIQAEIDKATAELDEHTEDKGWDSYTFIIESGKIYRYGPNKHEAINAFIEKNVIDGVTSSPVIKRRDRYDSYYVRTFKVDRGFMGATICTSRWEKNEEKIPYIFVLSGEHTYEGRFNPKGRNGGGTVIAHTYPELPESDYGPKSVIIPSWEKLRQKRILMLQSFIAESKYTYERIEAAIKHHRENPSSWHLAATKGA